MNQLDFMEVFRNIYYRFNRLDRKLPLNLPTTLSELLLLVSNEIVLHKSEFRDDGL